MLPLATATYTWQRATNISGDSGDPLDWQTLETGIPGTSSYLSGSESVAHGSRERVDMRIFMPADRDFKHFDRIIDEQTGDEWSIAYARKRLGLGISHTMLGCYEVTGTARSNKDL